MIYLGRKRVARKGTRHRRSKIVSLLILEGDTEEVFYPLIRDKFLEGIPVELKNIRGCGHTNRDVLSEMYKYTYNNPQDLVRAYCCLDKSNQKISAVPLELEFVRNQIRSNSKLTQILSVRSIIADPEIESWFFYDIDGIFKFLRMPRSQRNRSAFRPAQNFGARELQRLFERNGKPYCKGKRSRNFLESLDLETIVENCQPLRNGIQTIRDLPQDPINHIRP